MWTRQAGKERVAAIAATLDEIVLLQAEPGDAPAPTEGGTLFPAAAPDVSSR